MNKSIYQIAIECKEYSDSYIKYFNQIRASQAWYHVVGANHQFENLLLSLCDVASRKYPYIAASLKEHVQKYDQLSVGHQCVIDELVNYLINMEKHCGSDKKIFISHSSDDETIVNAFIKDILIVGCGFRRTEIFCTLDHTVIRTGDDFRNEIIENMKRCDYILCMISDNYRKSEVCQNELGAAWAMTGKRVLPFKFPNINFKEIGFLNVVKQTADLTDKSKLDELYDELCRFYDLPQDWRNFNQQKDDFIKVVNENVYE
jgi:hypothetical protein